MNIEEAFKVRTDVRKVSNKESLIKFRNVIAGPRRPCADATSSFKGQIAHSSSAYLGNQ